MILNFLKDLRFKFIKAVNCQNKTVFKNDDYGSFYPYELENVPYLKNYLNQTFYKFKLYQNNKVTNSNPISVKDTLFTLHDNNGDTVFSAFSANVRRFKVQDTISLIEENRALIDAIYQGLFINQTFFENMIMPYIRRATAMCLNLPASEGMHDGKPGGLLRHSLATAFESINLCEKHFPNAKTPDEIRSLKCTAFLLGLNHDLGKIFTDFTITSDSNEIFNPYLESLHHFVLRTATLNLSLNFVKSRATHHNELSPLSLSYLTAGLPHLLAPISKVFSLEDIFKQEHPLFKIVKAADIQNVRAQTSQQHSYDLNVNTHLASLLFDVLSVSSFDEAFKYGIFVVPYGVLIAHDSPLLIDLDLKARQLIYGEAYSEKSGDWHNLIQEWSKQGLILINGRHVIYTWHHLNREDKHYLVLGLIVKFKTHKLINRSDLEINALNLGTKAQDLSTLFSYIKAQYADKKPGIIVLTEKVVGFNLKLENCNFEKADFIFNDGTTQRRNKNLNIRHNRRLKQKITTETARTAANIELENNKLLECLTEEKTSTKEITHTHLVLTERFIDLESLSTPKSASSSVDIYDFDDDLIDLNPTPKSHLKTTRKSQKTIKSKNGETKDDALTPISFIDDNGITSIVDSKDKDDPGIKKLPSQTKRTSKKTTAAKSDNS